jgi:hypothetical protein
MINYKFNEGNLIQEFKEYIDKTYSGHYGQGKLQSLEVIVDRGHGMSFCLGNVDKYNSRYGKKGSSPDDYRADLLKVMHYALLALSEHDRIYSKESDDGSFTITFNEDVELTYGEWSDAKFGEKIVYKSDPVVYNTTYDLNIKGDK